MPGGAAVLALWSSATAVAALGTSVLFGAAPGLNWALCTVAASAGLLLSVRFGTSEFRRPLTAILVLTSMLAVGAPMTAASWFEWNLRHAQAARALQAAGIAVGGNHEVPQGGCVRVHGGSD